MRPGLAVAAALLLVWWLGLPALFLPAPAEQLAFAAVVAAALAWPHRHALIPRVRHPHLWARAAVAAFVFAAAVYAFRAYAGLVPAAYDLGIFDQIVYNLAQGDGFQSTLRNERSYLADHFSPILAILAPLYWVVPDPRALMLLQIVAVAATAYPLWRFTERRLGAQGALFFVVLFLLAVPARRLATYDFHPEAFAPLVLMAILERIDARRWGHAALLCVVAVTVKESMFLALAGVGLVLFFAHRRRAAGAALTVASLALFVLALTVVIPAFAGDRGFNYAGRYAHLGDGIGGIVENLITRPWLAYHLFYPGPKIEYLARLLLPLALLPLLGWRWTIGALFVWAQNAFTNYRPMHSIHFQYASELLPFLWAGAVVGLERLPAPRARWAAIAALFLTLLLHEGSELSRAARIDVDARDRHIVEALDRIPAEAVVSAQYNLHPRLSRRRHAYLFPDVEGEARAEWIAVDERAGTPAWHATAERYAETLASLPDRGCVREVAFDGFGLWRCPGATRPGAPPR